jgi:hypothetical protein
VIREECAYCGGGDRITRDHIPPKGLFPTPRTGDLVTVPACYSCNKSFELDDQYFVTSIGLRDGVRRTREGKQFVGKVMRSLQRPAAAKFAGMIASQIQFAEIAAPHLNLPPGTQGFVMDAVRLRRTAERIAKGLLFNQTGKSLPATHEIRGLLLEDLPAPVANSYLSLLAGVAPVELAAGRFAYITRAAVDDPLSTIWLLDFYADANFLVITAARRTATT